MAQVTNPRKTFQFTILVGGLNPFLAQEVTAPDIEIEKVEHGDTNFDVKTAGRVKYGDLKIEKIATGYGPDFFFWQWHYDCMDVFTGGGLIPPLYWRPIIIQEFSIDGFGIINMWECFNCWPTKLNGISWKRRESANTVESIEFSVERINRI